MELFKSYSKENALKVIAFAINFEQELLSTQISELLNRLEEKKINTYFNEQQIVSMTINQEGIPSQKNSISSIIFKKIEEFKLLWSLIIDKNRVVVTCQDYTRWDKVSSEALNYINIVLTELEITFKIAQITLEYLDEFEILEPTLNWKSELFKADCEYMTSNIYKLEDFWHISQGYFIKINNIDEKILDTIDINYFADERDNLKYKVNMRMQHKLYYDNDYNKNSIKDYFHKIHLHSKTIFFNIVNENVTEKFNIGEKL